MSKDSSVKSKKKSGSIKNSVKEYYRQRAENIEYNEHGLKHTCNMPKPVIINGIVQNYFNEYMTPKDDISSFESVDLSLESELRRQREE